MINAEAVIEKVISENRAIAQLLDQIHQSILEAPASGLSQWAEKLLPKATKLCSHLQEHFRLEEEDGFMTPVLKISPTSALEVESLRKEHKHLMEQTRHLLSALGAPTAKAESQESLCDLFKHLLSALRNHEQAEDRLLQKVFTEDLGQED